MEVFWVLTFGCTRRTVPSPRMADYSVPKDGVRGNERYYANFINFINAIQLSCLVKNMKLYLSEFCVNSFHPLYKVGRAAGVSAQVSPAPRSLHRLRIE